ncbi:MAG: hybrid sensor histidine kinase/response regulator, partial [Bdellovibrionales bacterium]|nr:hybrid sensor histidine kinase/response regulator [Bdellovibrionales bacterium]
MKHSILCVDDELDNVEALERIFRRKYRVLKAISGAEGLEILKQEDSISLIISDQRMPRMTGVEFLRKSLKTHPEAIRILLTGYTDIESVVDAINTGQVYRYMTKPWDPIDLANTVDKAIEKVELRQELLIKNHALEKALQELKSLDQAKTQFMVLVNHELKTPLTSLLSYSELLGESPLNEEQKKFHFRIDQSAQRLQTLINEVLELVSAETGQIKSHPTPFKFEEIAKGMEELWQQRCHDRKLEWSFKNLSSRDRVKADRSIVENILRRLTDNASKFSKEKTALEISIEEDPSDYRYVRISLRNQGKSMSKETIEKILKPFSLDEDLLHHTKGLGMGLSICQALLKTQDSQLEINSSKGSIEIS